MKANPLRCADCGTMLGYAPSIVSLFGDMGPANRFLVKQALALIPGGATFEQLDKMMGEQWARCESCMQTILKSDDGKKETS